MPNLMPDNNIQKVQFHAKSKYYCLIWSTGLKKGMYTEKPVISLILKYVTYLTIKRIIQFYLSDCIS